MKLNLREQMEKLRGVKQYQTGITLIALVITIVVLLILAGVSINTLFNFQCAFHCFAQFELHLYIFYLYIILTFSIFQVVLLFLSSLFINLILYFLPVLIFYIL